jgi:hypothetical protein
MMVDRVPTYVDAERLCFELSISQDTLARWMADGRIPSPVPGTGTGKRLWKWKAVEARIDGKSQSGPVSADRLGQEIENAARAATTYR